MKIAVARHAFGAALGAAAAALAVFMGELVSVRVVDLGLRALVLFAGFTLAAIETNNALFHLSTGIAACTEDAAATDEVEPREEVSPR